MGHFTACLGKTACTEGGSHCRACGRSFEEIEETRRLVDALTGLALRLDYDNPEAFAEYVARRLAKKVAHAREAEAAS